jgi:membrane fusion protein, multidrug efflux system
MRDLSLPNRPEGTIITPNHLPEIREYRLNYGAGAMPAEITEKPGANRDEAGQIDTRSTGVGAPVEHDAKASPIRSPDRQSARRRRLVLGVLGALILAAAGIFGIPWIQLALNTVSTDDAYVNGHVTFVAPRVAGQILRVLVDDNYRVHKGDLLAQIDKEPFEIAV